MKIGVYVCECGINIAATVDVPGVVEAIEDIPNVAVAKYYKYMCSDPGQTLIKKDIEEKGLDYVVVASCSPRMHESTFRTACNEGGLNPFCFEMANIREQCSWVHPDKVVGTPKAISLVKAAIARAGLLEPLQKKKVGVTQTALVIGAGIGGMQSALDIADIGYKTYLVERTPSVGGRMAQLDKTFPTMDCSACIGTPKMVDTGKHPNIELLTYSEVESVDGYVGNFKVKVRKKPRYVDTDKCTGCGVCINECPVQYTPQIEGALEKLHPSPERELSADSLQEINSIIDRHRDNKTVIMPILQEINVLYRYLPEDALRYVAHVLELPLSKLYNIATFYNGFSLTPRGRHTISICLGTTCYVRGAGQILKALERQLEVSEGGTTRDGKFTLEAVRCLGCCSLAPVIKINDDTYGHLTQTSLRGVLSNYD